MVICLERGADLHTAQLMPLDFTEARDSEWHQLGHMLKSAPRCSGQITTPAPHHSTFYKPDALPAAQPTA